MTIRSTCRFRRFADQRETNNRQGRVIADRRNQLGIAAAGIYLLTGLAAGCGMQGGQMLYMLGVGRAGTAPAKFTLTDEPVLILVDDPRERIYSLRMDKMIMDELAQELVYREAAKKIVPSATYFSLKQTRSDFTRLSARKVGELCGATQVIWIEVASVLITDQAEEASNAAEISVRVKVIDATQKEDPTSVRLWPDSAAGYPIALGISGARIMELKTEKAVAEVLSELLCDRLAKLFYEHQLGDFEKPG